MNRMKKLLTVVLALFMSFICVMSMTGCSGDIKKLQLKVQVYDYENHNFVVHTMDIDLYRHLAPTTVDAISSYMNAGYYDNTMVYKLSDHSAQIMVGDLDYSDGVITLKDKKPTLPGEFMYGGTKVEGGEALKTEQGTLGLWRSWYEQDGDFTGRNATNSGSATLFMPIKGMSTYDDYFCIFGKMDMEDDDNKSALEAIAEAFADEDYFTNYVIYYTGEYDNLQFHYTTADKFNEDEIEDLFVADGDQLVCYNHYHIRIPVTPQGQLAVKVLSAKVK